MKGGGSTYQALEYTTPQAAPQPFFKLAGGGAPRNCRRPRTSGGFYPSLMGGVISNGPLLMSAAVAQGSRLLRNESERMRSRKNRKQSRKTRRNASKRTRRSAKNTRKA